MYKIYRYENTIDSASVATVVNFSYFIKRTEYVHDFNIL